MPGKSAAVYGTRLAAPLFFFGAGPFVFSRFRGISDIGIGGVFSKARITALN